MDQILDVFQAYYEYQTTPNKDLYANMVLNLATNNDSIILTLVYLKAVERPDAYKAFYSLTPVLHRTGFTTLHELMGSFPSTDIPRWTWYSEAFEPNSELFRSDQQPTCDCPRNRCHFQTTGWLPRWYRTADHSKCRTGRTGTRRERPRTTAGEPDVVRINMGWWDADDDSAAIAAIESLHAKITDLARRSSANLEYIFLHE